MNCEKALRWISLEMDGELSPRRAARLQAHLDKCPACFKAREAWGAVGDRIRERQVPAPKSAEAAWADVRRAIRSEQAERTEDEATWAIGAPLRWAAAALLVMIVGAGLFAKFQGGSGGLVHGGGTVVEFVETGLPDATPMVYEDSESGYTVIWVVEANGKKGRKAKHAGS